MNINMEYRKGIIFLRLKGSLTKRTYQKLEDKVNEIIEDDEFTNIVINLESINNIDVKGISTLYYIYEMINKYKGVIYICLDKNENVKTILKKQRLLNYISLIDNELQAFDLVTI